MFLFFRGISKLITYIILLLHETNQRPLCVLGPGCCKTYWLVWNQISTMWLLVYCIACVHLCYKVSHGYFRLEKGSETTSPLSPPLHAWRMCNRYRRKESINLILYELKLIFCNSHYCETFSGNIVIVIIRWEFKVQACYFSIVPYICGRSLPQPYQTLYYFLMFFVCVWHMTVIRFKSLCLAEPSYTSMILSWFSKLMQMYYFHDFDMIENSLRAWFHRIRKSSYQKWIFFLKDCHRQCDDVQDLLFQNSVKPDDL